MLNMALKDRMQEIMDRKGWSQADLARAAGVSKSAVTQWMKGDTAQLSYESVESLHAASGFPLQWIGSGRGIKADGRPFALLQGGKTSQDLDLTLLREVVIALESHLAKTRRTAPPDKKADLVGVLYEVSLSAGKVEAEAVKRVLRLVG